MKNWLSYIMILFAGAIYAQEPLFVFANEEGIHLRWQGKYDSRLDGYHVYRKQEGALWERITNELLVLPRSTSESRNRSGNKSELLYAILGKTGGAITAKELADAATESVLFQSTCIANTELAWMLAERYTDKSAEQGIGYAYKVVWLAGNKETDWVESKLSVYEIEQVPAPENVNVVAGDGQVSLDLEPVLKDLKSGDAITWNIYRSESRNGPFEKINYENSLPLSVSQSGETNSPKLSHTDQFLTNGLTYFYRVKMVNVAGVEGPFSKIYQAVPKAELAPFAIKGFSAEVIASTAVFDWEVTKANALYEVYSRPASTSDFMRVQRGVTVTGSMQWMDVDFAAGLSVDYFMRATLENQTVVSDTITLMSRDYLPPKTPANVRARLMDSLIVELTWEQENAGDIFGFEIERLTSNSNRAGLKINIGYIQENSFIDTLNVGSTGAFYYRVFALDLSYQSSKGSELAKVVLPDLKPPQSPQFWTLKHRNDSLYLRWSAVPDGDFSAFSVYRVNTSSNGEAGLLAELSQTELTMAYADTGRVGFFIQASDTSGNTSISTDTLFVHIKPEAPNAPRIVLVEKKGMGLNIGWEGPVSNQVHRLLLTRIDPVDGKRLDVWQGGIEVLSYSDLYADPEKAWRYELLPYNRDWIAGEASFFLYEPPQE